MTTTAFPSDAILLQVEACYLIGTPPFICGVHGKICGNTFEQIEDELCENGQDLFAGEGTYLFDAHYVGPQFGELGRVEIEGYWDLTERGFRPMEKEAQK